MPTYTVQQTCRIDRTYYYEVEAESFEEAANSVSDGYVDWDDYDDDNEEYHEIYSVRCDDCDKVVYDGDWDESCSCSSVSEEDEEFFAELSL